MFCPVCKYEFRRGFTHCNQCDADLVDSLPAAAPDEQAAAKASTKLVAPTLLWQGTNSGSFSEIRLALDAAGIPYNREDLDARLLYTEAYTPLEIWVPEANLSEAQRILDEVRAVPAATDAVSTGAVTAQAEHEFPGAFSDDDQEDDSTDDFRNEDVTRELYAEDATAEIWSGADESMADILKSCLAEVGISCYIRRPDSESEAEPPRISQPPDSPFAVCVLPEDQSRAAEIVRQITSAAPPQ